MSTSHDDHPDHPPELPDDPSPADVDDQLEWHDQELAEINDEISRLRAATKASLAGDHERAGAILDELEGTSQ